MKQNKKILIILLLSFLLLSCGGKEEIKINTITSKSIKNISKESIKYNKEKKELSIGKKVVIKPGKINLPNGIKIYKNSTTYINSNVPNYLFFVINNKSENINNISNYYISLFNNLGYERVINKNNLIIDNKTKNNKVQEDLSNLEFILKNNKYNHNQNGDFNNLEKKYKQRIIINIQENTPENIQKGLGLDGIFTEIYFNQN